jgi:hypothetical protein
VDETFRGGGGDKKYCRFKDRTVRERRQKGRHMCKISRERRKYWRVWISKTKKRRRGNRRVEDAGVWKDGGRERGGGGEWKILGVGRVEEERVEEEGGRC